MDKKKKAIIIGGSVIAVGAFLYSQRGEDTPIGAAGSFVAAPIDKITGADDEGFAPDEDGFTPDEGGGIIPEIMEMLPTFGEGGDMLPFTPMPDMSPISGGGGMPVISKKASKYSSVGSLLGKAAVGTARVGATGVMAPTQFLGGGAARVTDKAIRSIMGSGYRTRLVPAQKQRTKKYPRASHAVSMITGGTTRRAPVSKKQYAARKKYPRIYKAWKSIFSWVGA